MQASQVGTLFDYNYWANRRITDAAAKLSAEQFLEGTLSHGSVRATLCHTLLGEHVWRVRCQTGLSPDELPKEQDFPSLQALLDRWEGDEQAMRGFLATVDDEALARPVRYTARGKSYAEPLWQILLHVVNHGTQTRSEAAVQLTHFGQSPGDLDLMLYLRRQAATAR